MIYLSKPFIGNEEIEAVVRVLKSGQLAQGERTLEFEKKFASFCGMKYAVAFSNATAAIPLLFMLWRYNPMMKSLQLLSHLLLVQILLLWKKQKLFLLIFQKTTFVLTPN